MADYYIVKDGVWLEYNAASMSAEFGHTPTQPRGGETSFGGRYENCSFISGAIDDKLGQVPFNVQVIQNDGATKFSVSGSV